MTWMELAGLSVAVGQPGLDRWNDTREWTPGTTREVTPRRARSLGQDAEALAVDDFLVSPGPANPLVVLKQEEPGFADAPGAHELVEQRGTGVRQNRDNLRGRGV